MCRIRGLAFAMALTCPRLLVAHPGVGIVIDRRGVVFYTDLANVWQIDPQGRRSIAVPNVHTHELAIDSDGDLIGEEVRGASGGWQHRVWRRSPDGRLSDVVAWTDGFWRDVGLLRDAAGRDYWVTCPERVCTIWRRESSGIKTTLGAGQQFNYMITWIALGADGTVFFDDGPDVRAIDAAGRISTLAARLAPPGNQNALMGLIVGRDSSVYVAVPSRRAVLRIDNARTTVAARSPEPWAPSGALLTSDGTWWLLEFDSANRVQVRRIRPSGEVKVFEPAVR